MSKRHPDNSAELKRQMANLKAKIERRKRVIEEGVDFFLIKVSFANQIYGFFLQRIVCLYPIKGATKTNSANEKSYGS